MSILDEFEVGALLCERDLSLKQARLDEYVQELCDAFATWSGSDQQYYDQTKSYVMTFDMLKDAPITQRSLETFCLVLPRFQKYHEFNRAGLFVSALVQHAYDKGFNEFSLQFYNLQNPLSLVCNYVRGRYDNPLRVNVQGEIGRDFCSSVQYVEAKVYNCSSTPAMAGCVARNSTFIFDAAMGTMCARHSHQCEYHFLDSVGSSSGAGAENCSFKGSKRTIDQLRQNTSKNCTFIYNEHL